MPELADFGFWVIAGLAVIGFLAGFVDSIAGGGGVIALPALLMAGVPPSMSLGTLKLQATFGSFIATLTFLRRGALNVRRMRLLLFIAFGFSVLGAIVAQSASPYILENVVPILLIAIALYMIFARGLGRQPSRPRMASTPFSIIGGGGLGFYDGFFGPGVGTFWAMAFVAGRGYDLIEATAHAKLVNFVSNVAALSTFIVGGKVVWLIGIVMGVGQLLGARIGALLVMKRGAAFVRPLIAIMSIAVTLRILWNNPDSWLRRAGELLWLAAAG